MESPDYDPGTAILTRRFDLSDGGPVDVFIWKPEIVSGGTRACPYLITGLGWDKISRCYGVDGFQAMQLTVQTIGVRLYASDAWKSGGLTWLGSRDLGMPSMSGEEPGGRDYKPARPLTPSSYSSVVLMPDQRFPYVAYPGERLNELIVQLAKIAESSSENTKATRMLKKVVHDLAKEREYYEGVCAHEGFETSYFPSDDAEKV